MFSRKIPYTPIAAALLFTLPLSALASAGKAIFVIGKVNVLNESGEEQRIRRGGEVNEGDTIVTNDRSQIQLRMSDGTLLAVRPNSKFRVDDYAYQQDISTDKSYYSLVKGGMRSITGAIGKENKSAYGVNTLVGTIGIRGTDYSARLCNSDCGDASDGLYVGVMQGAVVLSNDSGEVDVLPGDFGFMQDPGIEPSHLETPPGDLLFAHTDTETHVEVASIAESSSTSDSALNDTNSVSDSTPEVEVVTAVTSTTGDNLIINPKVTETTPTETNNEETDIIDPVITDPVVADPVIDDPVITDPIEPVLALPSSGTAIYSVVNNTDPTDGISTGTLDTVTTLLNVNFVDPSATANIAANFNNSNWDATTTQAMPINSDGSFAGDLYVTAADASGFGSTQSGTGTLTGSLSGSAEATIGAPADANMSYNMNDGTTTLTGDITLGVSNTSN